jgi:L-alanine-DL-glutamate epimerase-like enolase superfamily enzyme
MKIESVDLFYLAMPEVRNVGDGSQDALLVRVRAGGLEGWGECEAAPLPSIAAFCCPMSHSACKPVGASVLGETVETPADIERIGNAVRANSLDLLQASHTYSGIDIALWDLLGRKRGQPVHALLGYRRSCAKTPYASVLFGDYPQETLAKGQQARRDGFRAAKFGWGPFGRTTPEADRDQLAAAREGIGRDGVLLVDAGTVWDGDLERASERVAALQNFGALWLEEPFVSGAFAAYRALAEKCGAVKLAGGEGCHDFHMASHMIEHCGLGFIQIDTGRIGGISPAKKVADLAQARGLRYVNHTFTSNLALSASLQPYAGLADHDLCEYPVELSPLAAELTVNRIARDGDGRVSAPAAPGLGVEVNLTTVRRYLQEVEIRVGGRTLYQTPKI